MIRSCQCAQAHQASFWAGHVVEVIQVQTAVLCGSWIGQCFVKIVLYSVYKQTCSYQSRLFWVYLQIIQRVSSAYTTSCEFLCTWLDGKIHDLVLHVQSVTQKPSPRLTTPLCPRLQTKSFLRTTLLRAIAPACNQSQVILPRVPLLCFSLVYNDFPNTSLCICMSVKAVVESAVSLHEDFFIDVHWRRGFYCACIFHEYVSQWKLNASFYWSFHNGLFLMHISIVLLNASIIAATFLSNIRRFSHWSPSTNT